MPAIPVTDAAGVAVTGLTPGVVYSIWTDGGPWHPHGLSTGDDTYIFQLSQNGSTWSSPIGTSFDPLSPQSDTYLPGWCSSRKNLDSVHVLLTFTATTSAIWIRVSDNVFTDNTGSLNYESGTGALPFCQYGTSPQGALTGGVIITTGLIDILLTALGAPFFLAVIFDAFVGKTLWAGDLCSGLPPLMPQFTNDDFLGGTNVPNPSSLGKFWQAFEAIAWPYFCQCNSGPLGSPPPITVPSPTVLAPPAAPPGPITINCDDNDLCVILNNLMRQLSGMSAQIAQLRSDVALIQRQAVPFAYVPGTLRVGLTGNGQFAVQGIIGLAVELTTLPGRLGEEAGDPIAYFDAGWVTTGPADGWRRSIPIRHNPQWVDAQPDDTFVGYSFTPGIVANIQEFLREP